jgi:hypothetical protein
MGCSSFCDWPIGTLNVFGHATRCLVLIQLVRTHPIHTLNITIWKDFPVELKYLHVERSSEFMEGITFSNVVCLIVYDP